MFTAYGVIELDIENARTLLLFKGEYTEETVGNAYLERVKAVRNEPEFEETLKQLNIARDSLLDSLSDSRELAPILAKELAAISTQQSKLVQFNDAREEIQATFNSIEKRYVNRSKGTRDVIGLLSAVSAVLSFSRDNFSGLFPALSSSPIYAQMLLLTSGGLAVIAFMANHKSNALASRMQEIKKQLTRGRTISRILENVFFHQTSLTEQNFEELLLCHIVSSTGTYHKPSMRDGILEFYEFLGIPIFNRIYLGPDFIDNYIDYLIKLEHVKASGISGNNMMFHKVM